MQIGDKVRVVNSLYRKIGDIGIVASVLLDESLVKYRVTFDDGEIVYFTRFEIEKVEDNDMALGTMEECTKENNRRMSKEAKNAELRMANIRSQN